MLPTTPKKTIDAQSSSLGSISPDAFYFLSSRPVFSYQSPCLPCYHQNYLNSPLSKSQSGYFWLSSPIGILKRADAVLLKAYKAIEHEVSKDLDCGLIDKSPELKNNEAYLYSNLENDEDNSKDDWLAKDSKSKNSNTKTTNNHASSNWAKEKLV